MRLSPIIIVLAFFAFGIKALDWDEFLKEVGDYIDNLKSNSYSPTNIDEFFKSRENRSTDGVIDFGSFDFIIIGAGTAGGVVANRLTEDPFSVLLIEAGGEGPEWLTVLGLQQLSSASKWNWGYNTVSQEQACLAQQMTQCFYPRGKLLGGSSSINTGIYARGNVKDYDKWEALGNTEWSYKDCLPYFKKSERADFKDDIEKKYHGSNGLQAIGVPPDSEGITTNLLAAVKHLNKTELDYNGASQDGVSRAQFYIDFNKRTSSDYAYIQPAINRSNLNVTINSLVTTIRFNKVKKSAEGVEFIRDGQRYFAKANKEVIVSAGAINSPQVLMLSGVGPKEQLEKFDIDVVADLPVGQYLSDHMFYASISFKSSDQKVDALHTRDPLTHVRPVIILLHPKSIGNVTLKSSDPRDFPEINPNCFASSFDLENHYNGIQEVLKLADSEPFKAWNASLNVQKVEFCDGEYDYLTRDWWYCSLMHLAGPAYHPIGTTRMGPDRTTSVVSSDLKVHGFENLRVVDAGVIPSLISGHLNAPVVMIAEKISDVIKKDWGA